MNTKPQRVLVVDDDDMMRDSLTEALLFNGYDAVGVETAEAALEKVKTWPVHLFLLDLRLPKMGGMELLQELGEDSIRFDSVTGRRPWGCYRGRGRRCQRFSP